MRWAYGAVIAAASVTMVIGVGAYGGRSAATSATKAPPQRVVPIAPAITAQPQSTLVVEGQAAVFSVTAAGDEPLVYQWLRDGVTIAGATGAIYTVNAPTVDDDGAEFKVAIANPFGAVLSATVTLLVEEEESGSTRLAGDSHSHDAPAIMAAHPVIRSN
jgi:hypothetical protein